MENALAHDLVLMPSLSSRVRQCLGGGSGSHRPGLSSKLELKAAVFKMAAPAHSNLHEEDRVKHCKAKSQNGAAWRLGQ